MADNKTIHFIPPLPPKREKRVGIYCRVSTNSAEQLKSLTAQVSALTRLTAVNNKWLLVDVYIDIASSKTGSSRKEFSRMLQYCKSRDIEIILTKSISRFGRDTVEILDALNQLRALGVRVIFEQEVLDTADTDNDLMISIIESIAQAENESRSDNINGVLNDMQHKALQSYIIENAMGITMIKMVIWLLMRKKRKMFV